MSSPDTDPTGAFAAPCPSPEHLLLIARALLESRGQSADQRHLQECAGCQAELERMLLEQGAESARFIPSESLVARTVATRSVAPAGTITPRTPVMARRRLRRIMSLAAAGIAVLGLGLLWGIGTGVAAAHAENAAVGREPFSLTLGKALTALSCGAVATAAPAVRVQQGIPTIDLPPASAQSAHPIGTLAAIRQLANGTLLVLDGRGEIKLLDATLTTAVPVADSTMGKRMNRTASESIIRYRGDSTLLLDQATWTARVLDASGRVVRTMPLPTVAIDLAAASYTDNRGRVLFASREPVNGASDSSAILRVDFTSGRVDTVGRVRRTYLAGYNYSFATVRIDTIPAARGSSTVDYGMRRADTDTGFRLRSTADSIGRFAVVPKADSGAYRFWTYGAAGLRRGQAGVPMLVPDGDAWAVLSDGSLAIVRGHDYHIDWTRPDGTTHAGPKLSFDWQRLYEESRQQRVADSVGITKLGRAADGTLRFHFTVINKAGYERPISPIIPDLDGNLWVLPTMPASPDSALVYDVINGKGDLFERVRVAAGRSIVGFGKGGVVYLASGEVANTVLERVRMK